MNKFIAAFFIILFCFVTAIVCVMRPKTHKPIVFENKNFEVSMITENTASNITQINVEIETPQINIPFPDFSAKIEVPQIELTQKPIKKTNNNKTYEKTKPITKTKSIPDSKTNKEIKTETKTQEIKKEIPKTVDDKPAKALEIQQTPPKENNQPVKVLTEEEEIIAWNKWRSDLQNKLMKDSKIVAPIGTSFMFSFTIDKFGNITNLKTWSNNSSYTPLAVKIIKPLLLSYQHTAILKFPEGSQRIITNANGGFTMAHTSRYSSPEDYNDYERIKK